MDHKVEDLCKKEDIGGKKLGQSCKITVKNSRHILMDANAKTGPTQPPIVFEKDDQTSSNTPFLLEFLDMFGQCLPCTSSVQQGPQHTWTTPDGLTEHRIDYIAIPQELLPRCSWSGVVPTLDMFTPIISPLLFS
jgi:hypothetical protein